MFEILIVNEQTLRTGGPATLWDGNNERRVAKGCRLRWPFRVSGVPLLMENEINFGARGSAYYNPRCIYVALAPPQPFAPIRVVPPRYFHLSICPAPHDTADYRAPCRDRRIIPRSTTPFLSLTRMLTSHARENVRHPVYTQCYETISIFSRKVRKFPANALKIISRTFLALK